MHKLTGIVTSDRMQKTVVVTVHRYKKHPKYHKLYRVSKKFYADDPEKKYKVGDTVTIYECRPVSRLKRFTVTPPKPS